MDLVTKQRLVSFLTCVIFPDELRANSHRGQDLSEKQLLRVASKFGSEWKEAAIYLDLLSKDLDYILEKEKDVTMQKHRMLVMWKNRRRQGEATASALLESLKDMDKLSTYVRDILQGTV